MSSEFFYADQACKAVVTLITQMLTPKRSGLTIRATRSWYDDPERHGNLYVVQDGMLKCSRDGRTIFTFEAGDIVGVEHAFCESAITLTTDFAVVVDEYSVDDLLVRIRENSELSQWWNEFVGLRLKMFSLILASLATDEPSTSPDVMVVEAGKVILEQGSFGDEVYTLVDGSAHVMVDGVEVGEILCDEIFGAIAALTGSPRTASVIATTDCTVVAVTRDYFRMLLQTSPELVMKLMEDMARVIVSLNQKVKSISGPSQI